MSKSISLVVGSRLDPLVAAQLHQCVINAGAISAASAILCGLELQAIQKALKSTSTCTFDQWLEKHEAQLGFKRATAFKYKSAAQETKAKLLKSGDKALRTLLEKAPGSLSPDDRQRLLKGVSKCIGATTLMDIYLEAGIVKNVHKAPLRIGGGDSSSESSADPVKEAVDEQLELFGQRSNCLHAKTKLGKEDVLLISRWPKAKLETAIAVVKRDLQLLVKVKGAMP